jgi:hypothetical protein
MSRHRIKDVGYDDEDYYSDDGYASPDPEEQEFLQQCTTAVLQQLGAGQPSVTATKEEVQDALWHYYNDIEKSVNYLKSMYCLRMHVSHRSIFLKSSANLKFSVQARRTRRLRSKSQRLKQVSSILGNIVLSKYHGWARTLGKHLVRPERRRLEMKKVCYYLA